MYSYPKPVNNYTEAQALNDIQYDKGELFVYDKILKILDDIQQEKDKRDGLQSETDQSFVDTLTNIQENLSQILNNKNIAENNISNINTNSQNINNNSQNINDNAANIQLNQQEITNNKQIFDQTIIEQIQSDNNLATEIATQVNNLINSDKIITDNLASEVDNRKNEDKNLADNDIEINKLISDNKEELLNELNNLKVEFNKHVLISNDYFRKTKYSVKLSIETWNILQEMQLDHYHFYSGIYKDPRCQPYLIHMDKRLRSMRFRFKKLSSLAEYIAKDNYPHVNFYEKEYYNVFDHNKKRFDRNPDILEDNEKLYQEIHESRKKQQDKHENNENLSDSSSIFSDNLDKDYHDFSKKHNNKYGYYHSHGYPYDFWHEHHGHFNCKNEKHSSPTNGIFHGLPDYNHHIPNYHHEHLNHYNQEFHPHSHHPYNHHPHKKPINIYTNSTTINTPKDYRSLYNMLYSDPNKYKYNQLLTNSKLELDLN